MDKKRRYFVLNKKLDIHQISQIATKCRVKYTEHAGELCKVAMVGEYTDAFPPESQRQELARWHRLQKTDTLRVFDRYLENEQCMLLREGLEGRVLYALRSSFHIIRIFHNKRHRLGIAAGTYTPPTGAVPARILDQTWS